MNSGTVWKVHVGSATLYGIRDGGTIRDPSTHLVGSTPEALVGHERHFDSDGRMRNSFSCYLFETDSELVMVDTGFGAHAPDGMNAGHMPEGLSALGVSPLEIDHVVFTHLHPDHILGSMTSRHEPLFENAVHWTLEREVAHWRAETDDRSIGIARVANVLDDAGLLRSTAEPGRVVGGVRQMATYGHSPGHTAVRLSSGDSSVIIAGDVTFNPTQIDFPTWGFPLDVDPETAADTRAAFFDELAATGIPFAAGHYDDPGFGRVVNTANGRDYESLPVTRVDEPIR